VRGFWPVYKRELLSLFVTPLAWVLITFFLVVQGVVFYFLVQHFATSPSPGDAGAVQTFFGQTMLLYPLFILICPLLTMRLFSEERRSGTIESLLTTPAGASGIVLAKWGAALTTWIALWLPTLLYLFIVRKAGVVDWRAAGSSYLAIFVVGAAYLGIGTMASAFSKSQLVASVIAGSMLILLFVLGMGEFIVRDGVVHELGAHVSVWTMLNECSRGLVDSRRIVFHLSLAAVSLFVTVRAVESWRWA